MTDNQLNDDLSAFADDLRNQSLDAHVRDRDALMFRCGQSAPRHVEPAPISRAWLRQSLLVACAMCFGAVLMHWGTVSPTPAGEVIVKNSPGPVTTDGVVVAKTQELYSADEIAAVRSGQLLCASSNLDMLKDPRAMAVSVTPWDQTPTIRAGMVNRVGSMP